MRVFNKEIELIDLFCEFLDKRNCKYKRELRRSSYHNEGYIDLVLKIGKLFIGIEAKLNNLQSGLFQASSNSILCHYSYILYPRFPRSKCLNKLEDYGIGLIIYNNQSKRFEISIRAKKSNYIVSSCLKKIIRNWKENRCGRIINPKEIPNGYDSQKIEALRPDYKWVKTYREKKIEKLKKEYKSLDKFIKLNDNNEKEE